ADREYEGLEIFSNFSLGGAHTVILKDSYNPQIELLGQRSTLSLLLFHLRVLGVFAADSTVDGTSLLHSNYSTLLWDNLFDDLESQLEQELTAEEVDLQAEEERLRLARLGIRDRLRSLQAAVATDDRVLRL